MKTKEELQALKEEIETIREKLRELSDDELKLVTGGTVFDIPGQNKKYDPELYFITDPEDAKVNFQEALDEFGKTVPKP